jgi:acid phosphatase (class A)
MATATRASGRRALCRRQCSQARLVLLLAALLMLAGAPLSMAQDAAAGADQSTPTYRGLLPGYLAREQLPDSLRLSPPPPAPDSLALALDEEYMHAALALAGSARWDQATRDAELSFPEAAELFACALDRRISPDATPHLYRLLRRTLTDAGLATYAAKEHYRRPRPFVINRQQTCTPDHERSLVNNYAYPSGHAAVGMAWALVLTGIAPERTDALLARAREFGDSRRICNVHWHSDIVEGQFIGAATVALLYANGEFQRDLAGAREELAAAPRAGCE